MKMWAASQHKMKKKKRDCMHNQGCFVILQKQGKNTLDMNVNMIKHAAINSPGVIQQQDKRKYITRFENAVPLLPD